MRVRGGTNGLLSALEHGVCDELNADAPHDGAAPKSLSPAERRRFVKRARRRERQARRRIALAERVSF